MLALLIGYHLPPLLTFRSCLHQFVALLVDKHDFITSPPIEPLDRDCKEDFYLAAANTGTVLMPKGGDTGGN